VSADAAQAWENAVWVRDVQALAIARAVADPNSDSADLHRLVVAFRHSEATVTTTRADYLVEILETRS
jgi:hypothetical protein